ncbi:hypothetical protein AHF37_10310 [Paragonimus kellicotti]|nr:hypothetical protein AHF37_10310 [Paragonimus kellicotti]
MLRMPQTCWLNRFSMPMWFFVLWLSSLYGPAQMHI